MFHYTVETEKPLLEAIASIEESLKAVKFGVLWQFNIKEKLQEKGVDLNDSYVVMEVCHPQEAKRVLTENELASYFLPCKIVVYESEGKTKIGMPRPTALIGMLGDERLQDIATEVENKLISAIVKSK